MRTLHRDERFERLATAFETYYPPESGDSAELCVYHDGALVLDMRKTRRDNAVQVVRSVSKGIVAVLAAVLHEHGLVDLDAPIADVWPEFGRNGKSGITTRLVLTHQAGLPAIDEPLTALDALRWTPVVERLARQEPRWQPGTRHGYHDLTYGWLVGEVLSRATGTPTGELVQRELSRKLDLSLWIGTPLSELHRVEPVRRAATAPAAPPPPTGAPGDLAAAVFGNPDLHCLENSMEYLMAEVPAANAVTDARSLARLFAATVTEVDGVRLLSPEGVREAARPRAEGPDEVVGWDRRYGSGFMLPDPTRPLAGTATASFGHYGRGVAMVFAEPETTLAMAFTSTTERLYLGLDPVTTELASLALSCATSH